MLYGAVLAGCPHAHLAAGVHALRACQACKAAQYAKEEGPHRLKTVLISRVLLGDPFMSSTKLGQVPCGQLRTPAGHGHRPWQLSTSRARSVLMTR